MEIDQTSLPGVFVVKSPAHTDSRGEFRRCFCDNELSEIVEDRKILQINHSLTRQKGAIRGMHYQQSPAAEMKMIRCLRGRVFDVALDLRKDSPSFLQWFGQEISPGNALMMVLPEGVAHGFQVLEENAELLYLHTAEYRPDLESGIYHADSSVGIEWPLPATDVSERDKSLPEIDKKFVGLTL